MSAAANRLALRHAEAANAIAPWNPDILNTVALARYRAGRYKEALAAVAEAKTYRLGASLLDDVVNVLAGLQLGKIHSRKPDVEKLTALKIDDPDLRGLILEAIALGKQMHQ